MLNKNRIISELSLRPFGNKGWLHSENTPCMFGCGKSDKFGILFLKDGAIVKCMRCSEANSLFNYLLHINRKDLIEGFSAPIRDELKVIGEVKEEKKDTEIREVTLPKGFKRIYFDDYLDERGFKPHQYKKYQVGVSTERRLRFHIVFPIYQKGELVSWLARSRNTKEWHHQNLINFKNNEQSLVLRYYNSEGTEFSDIVGGLDEIRKGIDKTTILVEGLFDEANTSDLIPILSKKRGFEYLEKTKCCFTFGKSISDNQIKLIQEKEVENLIFMYDPDAIKEIEKYSMKYINKFKSISCVSLKDKDPGDLNLQEFELFLSNKKSVLNFYQTNIKKIV